MNKRKLIDLVGKKFGRWSVISEVHKKEGSKLRRFLCECDCGERKRIPYSTLTMGRSKSCGCYRDDKARNPSEYKC